MSGQNGSVPAAGDDAPDRRRRPAGLSEAQIIEAALRVIRKDGVDGLSMRRLSKELGVTPMAPYYYVSDKQALLDLVVSAALGGIEIPAAGVGPWHVRLRLVVDQIDQQVRAQQRAALPQVRPDTVLDAGHAHQLPLQALAGVGGEDRDAAGPLQAPIPRQAVRADRRALLVRICKQSAGHGRGL